VLAVTKFADMFLDALLGESALDLFRRGFGVGEGDFVFVDAGRGFFEKVAAGAPEDGGLPGETGMLAGDEED